MHAMRMAAEMESQKIFETIRCRFTHKAREAAPHPKNAVILSSSKDL